MTTAELRAVVPRVITKLENDEYDDAIKIAEQNSKVSQKIGPIRCYIHYKRQDYQRVLDVHKTLHSNIQTNLGMLHLLGQTHYKLGLKSGNFTQAVQTYAQIGELYPHESHQSPEYIVNALAAFINGSDLNKAKTLLEQVDFTKTALKSSSSPLITYESLFNSSFVMMNEYDLEGALCFAEKAYSKFQLENGNDADVSEDAILQYHIAYINNLQGKETEFKNTTESLLGDFDAFSVPVQTIFNLNKHLSQLQSVSTTSITIANNAKPHDLIKKIEHLKEQHQEKLSKTQVNVLNYNLAILFALQRSTDQFTKSVNQIPVERIADPSGGKAITTIAVPNLETSAAGIQGGFHKEWLLLSLQFYVLLKEKDYAKCEDLLQKYLSTISTYLTQSSTASYIVPYYINAILTKVFVALYRNQTTVAIALLTELSQNSRVDAHLRSSNQISNDLKLNQQPAMLALLITLHEDAKDFGACSGLIDSTISLYQKHPTFSRDPNASRIISQLRVKSATIKASAGDYKGAIAALEILANQCDKKSTASSDQYYHYISQIVTLCNSHCPELVDKYISLLPDPDLGDVVNIDLSQFALQLNAPQISTKTTSQSQFLPNGKHKFSAEKLAQVRQKKKDQKSKKPRLPKNITMEQYLLARSQGFPGVDQYRWKPKWERPQVQKGKKGQNLKAIGKGPQGSGISENSVETNVASTQTTTQEKKQQVKQQLKNNKKKGR